MKSDEQLKDLIRRAGAGDGDARNELFELYLESVLRWVRRRMPGPLRDRMESVDLVQSGVRHALEGLEGFEWRGAGSFHGWLCRVVENRIASYIRHWKSQCRDPQREKPLTSRPRGCRDASEIRLASADPSPSTEAQCDERKARLRAELDRLADQEKQVIELSLAGLSDGEIGERLGVPRTTVQRWKAGALRRLSHRLKDLVAEPPASDG